jgi:hypothetical protein
VGQQATEECESTVSEPQLKATASEVSRGGRVTESEEDEDESRAERMDNLEARGER